LPTGGASASQACSIVSKATRQQGISVSAAKQLYPLSPQQPMVYLQADRRYLMNFQSVRINI
jgi:hypothetical protein